MVCLRRELETDMKDTMTIDEVKPAGAAQAIVLPLVACCTAGGKLHLFEDDKQFLQFTSQSQTGLVMAWIDEVVIHRKETA